MALWEDSFSEKAAVEPGWCFFPEVVMVTLTLSSSKAAVSATQVSITHDRS